MNKSMKKQIIRKRALCFMIALMLLSVWFSLSACKDDSPSQGIPGDGDESPGFPGDGDEDPTDKIPYSFTVRLGGKGTPAGVNVTIKNTAGNTVTSGVTDSNGKFSFMALPATYSVGLSDLPTGYTDDGLTLAAARPRDVFYLNRTLRGGPIPSDAYFDEGMSMYDFSYTDVFGRSSSLGQVLEQKKMVLLNFWASWCGPCAKEFPDMQNLYSEHEDEFEIIALTTESTDGQAEIEEYCADKGLTFAVVPYTAQNRELYGKARVGGKPPTGIPTTLVIDRYGMVCHSVTGMQSESTFASFYTTYCAEDYIQRYDTSAPLLPDQSDLTAPNSVETAAIIGKDAPGAYYYYGDADYEWPYMPGADGTCLQAGNTGHNGTQAVLYIDLPLTAGQTVKFDYKVSSQQGKDMFTVHVDDELQCEHSGIDADWQTFSFTAESDGNYLLRLTYAKDGAVAAGDDTVFIKAVRIESAT